MKAMILALVLALGAENVIMAQGDGSAKNAVMAAERLQAEPDIDGVIESDPAWKNIPWNEGAFYILNTEKKADLQTRFKIGYTAKGIYLAIQCDEPQSGNMLAVKNDMESVWSDDSLEIWLSVGNTDKMQLVLNSTGARNNAGCDILLDWPVATFIGENFWNAEMFIPYETIKQIPESNWQLGVCRNIQTLKTKPCFTTWRLSLPARAYADLSPVDFRGSLSEQEKKAAWALIQKKKLETLKKVYSLAAVSPGKGLELQRKGIVPNLLVMAHGSGIMPRISPDGSSVYFNSTSGGRNGIWKVDISDKKTVRICDGSQAACSADGKSVVFQRDGRIISRSLKEGIEKNVSPEAWTNCASPDYLPDGRVIFIVAGKPDKMYLASVGKQPELLFSGELGSAARCSPDGRMIAYQAGPHIWLYEIASRSSRQLTSINGIQCYPSWTKDSQNVIFCQLFDQFNSVGDVYVQDIAGKNIERIAQNVDAFHDFNGEWKFSKNAVALPVISTIRRVTDAKETTLDGGGATLTVSAASNKILWTLKDGKGKQNPLQIVPLNSKGAPFSAISSIKVTGQDNNRAVCRVELSGTEPGAIIIAIESGLPVVKINFDGAANRVELRHELSMVAGCDRYAWDMLYLPQAAAKYPAMTAYSPLMVLFPENRNCLFMLMAPEKDVWLLQGKTPADFGGISVAADKNNGDLFLFGLSGENLWGTVGGGEVNVETSNSGAVSAAQCGTSMCPPFSAMTASLLSGKTITMQCSIPAALQWRYVIADKHGNDYSGMFTANAATNNFKFKIPALPVMQRVAAAYYYPYDRVKLTPMQNSTPMDLIINTVGLKQAAELFDIRGVREVKPAKPECMYKDYRIILNWYKYAFITQICAADTACRLADDLTDMFNGVINRNIEYQKFFAELKPQADKLPQTELADQINDIIKASEKLNAGTDNVKKFNDAVAKFKAAAKKLNARDAKDEFSATACQLFQQEISNMQQYRLFARQVRMVFGRLAALYPDNKASYEKIRDDCRKLLLYPVYHENMNNDENIINPEIADYETTK
ncbi:MAG: hypothetical protein ACYC4Q_04660 [Victivallaceae bacterium]